MDGIASHILCSTIDTAILNSLPMPNICLGKHRTAHSMYTFLCQHYSSRDYNSVMNIKTKLRSLSCSNSTSFVSVHDYISTYRLYMNEMNLAGYPIPSHQLRQLFTDTLLNNIVFSNI